jgi:hypothetical protein
MDAGSAAFPFRLPGGILVSMQTNFGFVRASRNQPGHTAPLFFYPYAVALVLSLVPTIGPVQLLTPPRRQRALKPWFFSRKAEVMPRESFMLQ